MNALAKLIDKIESYPLSSGVCMCGSEMEGHSVYDNHSPTDSGEYHLGLALKEAKAEAKKESHTLGWFSGQARKHGYYDQADWLDEYRKEF